MYTCKQVNCRTRVKRDRQPPRPTVFRVEEKARGRQANTRNPGPLRALPKRVPRPPDVSPFTKAYD